MADDVDQAEELQPDYLKLAFDQAMTEGNDEIAIQLADAIRYRTAQITATPSKPQDPPVFTAELGE